MTAHRRPAPPYDAGPEAARLGATAMIDVSDGLLADLGHVAAASGVQVNVNRERLAPSAALRAAAASLLASAALIQTTARLRPTLTPRPFPGRTPRPARVGKARHPPRLLPRRLSSPAPTGKPRRPPWPWSGC